MMYYWSIGRNGKVWTYQQQPGTPMYDKIIRNAHIRQKSKADLFLATVPIEHSFFICSVVSLRQILPTSGCEPITSCEPLMLIFTDIGEVELLPLYLWLWTYNQLWTDNVNIYWHRGSRIVTLVPIAVKYVPAVPIYRFKAKMIILAISSTDNNDVYQPKKIEPALILLQPISFTVLRQYTDIEPPSSWHANP